MICEVLLKSKKVLFQVLIYSVGIWLMQYCVGYYLLRAMNVNLDFSIIVLGTTLSLITNVLPIPSIGNLGVYESSWAMPFIYLGIEKDVAIKSAFFSHIVTYFYLLILGIYGVLSGGYKWRK